MKSWRIWFLLLLAVLLPVRGAVAAAMLCAVAGSGVQTELVVGGQAAGHQTMDQAQSHDHAGAQGQGVADHGDGHAGHDHTGSDKCNMCSAYCSLTPLVSNVLALVEPPDLASVKFSDHAAPAPSFLSDGQERPPRTI